MSASFQPSKPLTTSNTNTTTQIGTRGPAPGTRVNSEAVTTDGTTRDVSIPPRNAYQAAGICFSETMEKSNDSQTTTDPNLTSTNLNPVGDNPPRATNRTSAVFGNILGEAGAAPVNSQITLSEPSTSQEPVTFKKANVDTGATPQNIMSNYRTVPKELQKVIVNANVNTFGADTLDGKTIIAIKNSDSVQVIKETNQLAVGTAGIVSNTETVSGSGKRYVLKKPKYETSTQDQKAKMDQELKEESKMSLEIAEGCPHILPQHCVETEDGQVVAFSELCENGKGADFISKNKETLTDKQIVTMADEMFEGICHMLEKGFLHGDPGLHNIFCDGDQEGNPHVKIADFGAAFKPNEKAKFTVEDFEYGNPIYQSSKVMDQYPPLNERKLGGIDQGLNRLYTHEEKLIFDELLSDLDNNVEIGEKLSEFHDSIISYCENREREINQITGYGEIKDQNGNINVGKFTEWVQKNRSQINEKNNEKILFKDDNELLEKNNNDLDKAIKSRMKDWKKSNKSYQKCLSTFNKNSKVWKQKEEIYGWGVAIYQILSKGETPYKREMTGQLVSLDDNGNPLRMNELPEIEGLSPQKVNLLQKMVHPDPEKRLSPKQFIKLYREIS